MCTIPSPRTIFSHTKPHPMRKSMFRPPNNFHCFYLCNLWSILFLYIYQLAIINVSPSPINLTLFLNGYQVFNFVNIFQMTENIHLIMINRNITESKADVSIIVIQTLKGIFLNFIFKISENTLKFLLSF